VDLPKTVSVWGDRSGERLREPVPGVLCQYDGGWLLIDTGLNPPLLRDPSLYGRFFGRDPSVVPLLPGDGDPLQQELARAGVSVGDITTVAVSHLHYDHAGGLRHFAGRVPVHVQKAELEYGLSAPPGPEQNDMFRVDYDDPRIDWYIASGDTEIVPGVTALSTPGHTPGHQSFIVELEGKTPPGGFLFACDAADLQENLDKEVPIGCLMHGTAAGAVETIRHLKAVGVERGLRVVPGHDPAAWPALTEELAARWPT